MEKMANRISEELERKNGGNQSEMARFVGVSPQAVQKWVSGAAEPKGKNLAKVAEFLGVDVIYLQHGKFGQEFARRYEALLEEQRKNPVTIVDLQDFAKRLPNDVDERRSGLDRRSNDGEIEIPQYRELGGSMGAGLLLRDQPGEIQKWSVTPDWISKNVKNYTGANNLRIVTGFGDSMRPLYNPGDPLLVDAGVKTVDFDSIYFFRIGEEGFIKRLQRVPGQGLLAISENKSYRDWVITQDMDFEVFARVIKVWCGAEF